MLCIAVSILSSCPCLVPHVLVCDEVSQDVAAVGRGDLFHILLDFRLPPFLRAECKGPSFLARFPANPFVPPE